MKKHQKIKDKKVLFFALSALFLVAFGVTFAVSRDRSPFHNNFNLAESKVLFTEQFDSPPNWLTCEEVEKTINIKNESETPVAVRLKLEEQWIAKDGTELPLISDTSGYMMAIIDLVGNSSWVYDDVDDYYYYTPTLGVNDTTSPFMRGVMLNCDANLDEDKAYSDADYHLKITAQTVEADKKAEVWHTNYAKLKSGPELNKIFKTIATGTPVDDVTTLVDNVSLNGELFFGSHVDQSIIDLVNQTGIEITMPDSPQIIYAFLQSEDTPYSHQKEIGYYSSAELQDVSGVKYNHDLSYLLSYFGSNSELNIGLNRGQLTLDTNSIKSLAHLYEGSSILSTNLGQLINGPHGSPSNIDMSYIASGSLEDAISGATNILKISRFRPNLISDLNHAFYNIGSPDAQSYLCSLVSGSDFSNINTSSVENTSYMFAGGSLGSCSEIRSFSANESGTQWNVSKVRDMSYMFEGNTSLTSFASQNYRNNINTWMNNNPGVDPRNGYSQLYSNESSIYSWNVQSQANITGMFDNTNVSEFPYWYTHH